MSEILDGDEERGAKHTEEKFKSDVGVNVDVMVED